MVKFFVFRIALVCHRILLCFLCLHLKSGMLLISVVGLLRLQCYGGIAIGMSCMVPAMDTLSGTKAKHALR